MYKISVIELTEIEIIMEVEGNRYKVKKKKKKVSQKRSSPSNCISSFPKAGIVTHSCDCNVTVVVGVLGLGFFLNKKSAAENKKIRLESMLESDLGNLDNGSCKLNPALG